MTIQGLHNSIEGLKQKIEEIPWYDVDWLLQESEPIYGLAFIAFQNYINGSIKDLGNNTNTKENLYKLEQNAEGFSKSKIELIIGLANYAKHKDEGIPHKGTKEILECFKLDFHDITYLDKSAIFQGLTILNNEWDLFEIKAIVINWREKIWAS
jgi:hypothetical protein